MGIIVTMMNEKIKIGVYLSSTEKLQSFFENYEFNRINLIKSLESKSQKMDIFEVDSIYFGQEFCKYLYPSSEDILKAYHISKAHNLNFTFISGILSEKEYSHVREIITNLSQKPDIKFTINDPGLLFEFKEISHKINIGRLRIKQKRVYSDLNLFNEKQLEYMRDVSCNLVISDEKYNALEIDPVSQNVDYNSNFHIYYPFSYITSSRICSIASSKTSCTGVCKNKNIMIKKDVLENELKVFKKGKVFFFDNSSLLKDYINNSHLKRIIFEYGVPLG